jgi:hypothetical protein
MPENANFLEIVTQRAPHCGMALTPEYRSRLRVYGVFTKVQRPGWHFTQLSIKEGCSSRLRAGHMSVKTE